MGRFGKIVHTLVCPALFAVAYFTASAPCVRADVPIGGFIPFTGITLTDEFKDSVTDPTGTFFISDPEPSYAGNFLAESGTQYYDIALLDTGAATHILTEEAAGNNAFDIVDNGLGGTNFQNIGGATGIITLRIDDPMAIFSTGLQDRTGAGAALTFNNTDLRGQSSFALLSAPSEWKLPNILGLPMAAHHAISIRNDQPQIFEHKNRTVRTPSVEFMDLGTGGQQGILRRTDLKLRPGLNFVTGPIYVFNTDILGGFDLHDNPRSPSVVENAAMFVEVDLADGPFNPVLGRHEFEENDIELLFDTGADLTVVSELAAKRLGFDALIDTPDFVLSVEGSGGVTGGVPGFYLEELNIDTVGGSFTKQNVPIAVLNVTNPNDPGNTIDGILGMHLFTDRNIVIDAEASIGQGGNGPSLYISDSITGDHTWTTAAASGTWANGGNWVVGTTPDQLAVTTVGNVSGSDQKAVVAADSTVYRTLISGGPSAEMSVEIQSGVTLTVYADIDMDAGSRLHLDSGSVDAQFIDMDGGTLSGNGDIFVGTGPINGSVRNRFGVIAPGATDGSTTGKIAIEGDLSQEAGGTTEIDLGGLTAGTGFDQIEASRLAFLDGTLDVSLSGGFTPQVGNMFEIISALGGETNNVFGMFATENLPAGFNWDVAYNADGVLLTVLPAGITGDYNGDGFVNASDYTVWLDTMGSTTNLAADGNGNSMIDVGDYTVWKGAWSGSSSSAVAVPEPSSGCLLLMLVLASATAQGINTEARRTRRMNN